jgi:collagenase-like PrtC family protease
MRIVVGLPGTADVGYVESLRSAGADEFFVGYVPAAWHRKFGFEVSPNRRYRRGQQVTDAGHLAELCAAAVPCPVAVTLNEHIIGSGAWAGPARALMGEAVEAGVKAAVVAGPGAALLLAREFPGLSLHMSGDGGVYNAAAGRFLAGLGVRRLIFPRELPFADLAAVGEALSGTGLELEAFVMGEPCVYDGARCFTEHGYGFSCDFCNHHSVRHVVERGRDGMTALPPAGAGEPEGRREAEALRLGKCGLCAIPYLSRVRVTHIKVPGRASVALPAVRLVRAVLSALEGDAVAEVPGGGVTSGPGHERESRRRAERVARELLGAPRLCAEGRFCYFPELRQMLVATAEGAEE